MRQNIFTRACVLGAICFVIGFIGGALLTKSDRERTNTTIAALEAKVNGIQTTAQKQIDTDKGETKHFQSDLKRITKELLQANEEMARLKEEKRIAAEQKRIQEEESQRKQAKLEEERRIAAEQKRIQEQEYLWEQAKSMQLKADLVRFKTIIKSIDIDNSFIDRCSVEDNELVIVVTDVWHEQPYQLRLQTAQNLWNLWAKIRSLRDPDEARIKLTDYNGNSVGGSRWLAGSLIWVQEK
jgi:hypothetical protein